MSDRGPDAVGVKKLLLTHLEPISKTVWIGMFFERVEEMLLI
jgi:hypothetical protein